MCRLAQKRQEEGIANDAKTNPKKFWNFIRSKTTMRTGVADVKKKDGSGVETDKEETEILNTFFQGVFTNEDLGPPPDPPRYHYEKEL